MARDPLGNDYYHAWKPTGTLNEDQYLQPDPNFKGDLSTPQAGELRTVKEAIHTVSPLPENEARVLQQAKDSNPYWYKALLQASKIQAERRAKYSGEDFQEDDPYTNFIIVASLMGISVSRVFRFYLAQKIARLMVTTGDYQDERYMDTLRDLGNYAFLAAGWETRSEEEQWTAVQQVVVKGLV
jgi:hypothetical protein